MYVFIYLFRDSIFVSAPVGHAPAIQLRIVSSLVCGARRTEPLTIPTTCFYLSVSVFNPWELSTTGAK